MNFIASGAIALGFSMFQYCSSKCSMRCVTAALEEVEKQIQTCPCCRKLNEEILRAAAGSACADKADPCPMPQELKANHAEAAPTPDACPPCPRRKCKGGRISTSPFFNFLREQRPKACGEQQAEFAVRQAKIWNAMTQAQKDKYTKSAIYKEARGHNKLQGH